MIKILIADNHEVVRSGLRRILEAHPKWEVVAEAENGSDAVSKAIVTKPDIAVIDHSQPVFDGIEVTREIRSGSPKTEVLIFTMHDNEKLIENVLKAGARGYVLKSDANQDLVDAIEALAAHKPYFTSKVSNALLDAHTARSRGEKATLTNREGEILQLIAEGCSNKLIARLLKLSFKTVETHRAAVMRKLELGSLAGLVRYAIRNKIVEA
jgi:DNA-binding NarL/FixJ family response regulator